MANKSSSDMVYFCQVMALELHEKTPRSHVHSLMCRLRRVVAGHPTNAVFALLCKHLAGEIIHTGDEVDADDPHSPQRWRFFHHIVTLEKMMRMIAPMRLRHTGWIQATAKVAYRQAVDKVMRANDHRRHILRRMLLLCIKERGSFDDGLLQNLVTFVSSSDIWGVILTFI